MTEECQPGNNSPGLYVHLPWCVRKCPYCDFNSHEKNRELPQQQYLQALLQDLQAELNSIDTYPALQSIFFGGGTPSLLPASFYQVLLRQIDQLAGIASDAEITLEANPGAVDSEHFADYRQAGINRLSLGVQSFNDQSLSALGRIHSANQAGQAFKAARAAGFDNINIDLMHGLPGQLPEAAFDDLRRAFALQPEHISWYQLTIEPNTVFYSNRPPLPGEEVLGNIFEQGLAMLQQAGYRQYEVSAFALPGRQSQHNLNYWRFGDYIGIGAGAHGKVSVNGRMTRRWKTRMPNDYLQRDNKLAGEKAIASEDIAIEYLMNALRLRQGFAISDFEALTGKSFSDIAPTVESLVSDGLLQYLSAGDGAIGYVAAGYYAAGYYAPVHDAAGNPAVSDSAIERGVAVKTPGGVRATDRGYLFLNDVIAAFQTG